MPEIDEPILAYLREVVAESGSAVPVTRDTQLLEAGLLDSINLVRLIQFLEARFKITIPDGDLGPELFDTPASLSGYVVKRLG